MKTFKPIHARRLLNVARALEESPNPDRFTMEVFAHPCGTPACALGHYCARSDLQTWLELSGTTDRSDDSDILIWPCPAGESDESVGIEDDVLKWHFGISESELALLFDADGCGGAKTANKAALYIRNFVARKELEAGR